MNHATSTLYALAFGLLSVLATAQDKLVTAAQDQGCQHRGAFMILTTAEGADLPASAVVKEFPLLLSLAAIGWGGNPGSRAQPS